MLDQSFSAENFRIIFDIEYRKGINLEFKTEFLDIFKLSREKSDEIKKINAKIKDIRKKKNCKKITKKSFYEEKTQYDEEKSKCKDERDVKLTEIFKNLASPANKEEYRLTIKKGKIFKGNQLYEIEKNPVDYFVLKQLQRNIFKTFDVKQGDRTAIISQLRLLVKDDFPKLIIRTDIEKFYETIPHKQLLTKIEGNNLLSYQSKKIIKDILNQYWNFLVESGIKNNADNRVGIPRGIGVSAYLSELYLRDIDRKIKSLPNVTYFARYVDDIIIIITPNHKQEDKGADLYMSKIRDKIIQPSGLAINEAKTKFLDLRYIEEEFQKEVTYLGYKFNFKYKFRNPSAPNKGFNSEINLSMSNDKLNRRYKRKIELSFEDYRINMLKYSGKESATKRRLIQRITFLSTNTQLLNRKSDVMVGIFFSNQFLCEPYMDLTTLDKKLVEKINGLPIDTCPKLKSKLLQLSFCKGFTNRIMAKFDTNSFENIIKIWNKL